MRVLGTGVITDACEKYKDRHPRLCPALKAWLKIMRHTDAKDIFELKEKTFNSIDPVPPQTVFDIMGNEFRLIAKINYKQRVVRVQHVLTHKEYDKGSWKE